MPIVVVVVFALLHDRPARALLLLDGVEVILSEVLGQVLLDSTLLLDDVHNTVDIQPDFDRLTRNEQELGATASP